MLMALSVCILPSVLYSAFSPQNRTELKRAVDACLKLAPRGNCTAGPNGPIGLWNVSAVTDMHEMFYDAQSFNQNLSAWDVSAATNMNKMFSLAKSFNWDLSKWGVSAVTDMSLVFYGAQSFNQDLSAWDVSAVTDMHQMFDDAQSFNQDLSAWDVSAVTSMHRMFGHAERFNRDLSKWGVSAVTDMSLMFYGAQSFNQDLSEWDVSAVTDMGGMFQDAQSFNQNLSAWDVSAVTDMHGTFYNAQSFNQDLSTWDVSGVTIVSWMFCMAHSFNQDLSEWDVSAVTDMSRMFCNAHSFNQDLSTWDVSAVADMHRMFDLAISFNQDLSAWHVSAVTNMNKMFHRAISFDQTLCGVSWVISDASRSNMFKGSRGKISPTVCTTTTTGTTTTKILTINTATTAATATTTTTTTMDIKTATITIAMFVLISVVVVLLIVFVCRSNKVSGETSMAEMPLLPHNAPTVPNPESRHREPGDVFIEENVENYRDVHAVPVQPERPSLALTPDSLEALSTTTPNTHVDIDSEEPGEVFIEEIVENYRDMHAVPIQPERPSLALTRDLLEAVSTTTTDTHVDIDSEEFRENLLAVHTIHNDAFVLITVNANTFKAARAAVFNADNVTAMMAFVTSLSKSEVVMAVARNSLPKNWSPRELHVLRSLRSGSGSLRVDSSPFAPVGAEHPYPLRALMHEDHWPGEAVNVAIQSPLTMCKGVPVSIAELEGTHRDRLMMDMAPRQLPSNIELVVFQDVTADVRRRQDQAIVSSFRNIQGVILVITDTQWHLSIEGDVLGVTGYTAREFLESNMTMRDFQSPDVDRAEVASFLATVLDPNLPFVEVNIPHVHKHGHTIWLRACHGTRAIGATANGNPKVLVVFSDVTTTVVAQREALVERDALLRRITFVPVMIFEMVADDVTGMWHIVYASPQSTSIFGLTPDEMTSSCEWMQMLHPDEVERYVSSIAESKANMQEWELEFRIVVGSKTKYLHGRAAPRREGTRVVWSGAIQDITASHNLRQMKKKRNIQDALAERLNAACAFLAHEVRNKLSPHSLILDVMKDEASEWTDKMNIMLHANKTVTAILNGVLNLAKCESGEFSIDTALFPLMRLFQSIATYAKANGATVEGLASIQPTWHVEADEHLLKQAVTNLVLNASKLSDNRPFVVSVAFEQTNAKEGVIMVIVADKGRGMTPDQLAKVMAPFGHLRQADEAQSETGLGLPLTTLTKVMIESGHKGTFTLTSEGLGKGATASIRVPVLWEHRREEPHHNPVLTLPAAETDPNTKFMEEQSSSTTDPVLTSVTHDNNPSTAMASPPERTFATSNYKRFYADAMPIGLQHNLLSAVETVLTLYGKRISVTEEDKMFVEVDVLNVMIKIQDDAFKDDEAMKKDISAMAEYLWTSCKTHRIFKDMALCSVLNSVIRDDVAEEIEAATIIFRSINYRRIRRGNVGTNMNVQSYPSDGETWRGGGFRREHREFFERRIGKKYRVPGFLATSLRREIAATFAFKAVMTNPSHPCAMWRITFDPRGEDFPEYRVRHMTLVSKTLVAGEQEYLFAPYSVFTLVSVKWGRRLIDPHQFTVQAARDNSEEDEGLSLSPWY